MIVEKEAIAIRDKAIRNTVLKYIQAYYQGDADLGIESLHPNLAKRTVKTDSQTGRSRLEPMSATTLAERWRAGLGKSIPEDQRQMDITILDMYEEMASVKLVTAGWVDYMHLAKFDGEWAIVNVLWALKPSTS